MKYGIDCNLSLFFVRIPEVGPKVVSQGAVPALEKALHTMTGFCNINIRYMIDSLSLCVTGCCSPSPYSLYFIEKRLYMPSPGFHGNIYLLHILSPMTQFNQLSIFLSLCDRLKEVRSLITTPLLVKGMQRELERGTEPSKYTVVQMMLNLHNHYESGGKGEGEGEGDMEEVFVTSVRDIFLVLLKTGMWHARNLCVKVQYSVYIHIYIFERKLYSPLFPYY